VRQLPEWLKSSKQHQVEVLLAGLALWQLKRQLDRRLDEPGKPEPHPYPMSEPLDNETVFVWPTDFNEDGEPRAVSVGIVDPEKQVLGVNGIIQGINRVISDRTSERNKTRLKKIKTKLSEAEDKLKERAGKYEK
jgi:hypothetical protein